MQRRLRRLFSGRQVGKRYLAVVSGSLPTLAGQINLPLGADWPKRPRQKAKGSRQRQCALAGEVFGVEPGRFQEPS